MPFAGPHTRLNEPIEAGRAVALSRARNTQYLKTLARVHADMGDYASAARVAAQAAQVAQSQGDEAIARELTALAAQYRR